MASKRKRQPPVIPLQVPAYAEVAWLYGRRLLTTASSEVAVSVAHEIAQRAQARGLSPANLHGTTQAPLGSPTELVLGAIPNGAPIVRDTPEMREGILSREHRVVAARYALSGKVTSASDEDLSVESEWASEVGAILDEVEATPLGGRLEARRVQVTNELMRDIPLWDAIAALPLSGLAWHLVARVPGRGGMLMYGALLPNAGDGYADEVVETLSLTSRRTTSRYGLSECPSSRSTRRTPSQHCPRSRTATGRAMCTVASRR